MADVAPETPRIRCDNCGFIQEKEKRNNAYSKPDQWGYVIVSATNNGSPNDIKMADLCPSCNSLVHEAVTAALKSRNS
ncbi:MAG: hypothetical protein GY938_24485 [Ketobacter sp.]|nr:hypothetical protein [Ketobacter sp.]